MEDDEEDENDNSNMALKRLFGDIEVLIIIIYIL
jgi:hypothetical protein